MSQVDRVPEVRAYRQVPERAESTTAQIESPIIAAGLGLDRPGAQVDGLTKTRKVRVAVGIGRAPVNELPQLKAITNTRRSRTAILSRISRRNEACHEAAGSIPRQTQMTRGRWLVPPSHPWPSLVARSLLRCGFLSSPAPLEEDRCRAHDYICVGD